MIFRRDIQGLRAVAVLSVMVTHAGLVLRGGYVGVDIFFVISGYLITGLINEQIVSGQFSIADFYRRRILRIIPALLVVTAATLVAAYFIVLPIELEKLANSAVAAVLSISNIYFWNDAGYFTDEAKVKPMLHTWSLGVEEQFYILLPLLMVAVAALRRRWLLAVITALSAASLVIGIVQVEFDPRSAFYLLPARLWELGIGGVLAVSGLKPKSGKIWAESAAALGALLIVFSVTQFDERTPFPGAAAIPPCLGTALIIWAGGGAYSPFINRVLSLGPMVFIGAISYSLYLWHWPILVYAKVLGYMHGPARLLLLLAAIAMASLSWRFIEQPAQALRTRLPASKVFASALVGIGLIASVAFLAISTRGFVGRLTAEQAHLQTFLDYDKRSNYDYGVCFLGREHSASAYDPRRCLDRPSHVVLVGDSFAAQLLPGVRQAFGEPRQATASGCKPLVHQYSEGARTCAAIVGRVLAQDSRLPGVDTVVIGGRWTADNLPDVRPTLLELHRRGLRTILVGPIPEHSEPLARALLSASLTGKAVPQSPLLIARQWRLDTEFRNAVSGIPSVTYVSPMSHFCSQTQCRQMIGADPLQWDTGHLTAAASIDLLAEVPKDLPELGPRAVDAPAPHPAL